MIRGSSHALQATPHTCHTTKTTSLHSHTLEDLPLRTHTLTPQRTHFKIMAECQNFFDDTSPSACRSSSSTDQSPRNECADHALELCLGPSADASKIKQHEMVRPIPLYPSLGKQRSGNFAHAIENSPLFRGHSDVAMADKALSKDSAFTTPPRISREQVWQTLQKTNAVLGQQDACTSKAFCEDAVSSMLGRRSTSMQITMASSEMSELDVCPIRRSCSNGIPISRQSSFSQEALVDESPDPTSLLSYNRQHEALELQKRREMQAHRRLEARKRRRLLMEEKQQKKARQNSGLNNRHCISPIEKDSLVTMRPKERNCASRPQEKNHHKVLCANPGGEEGLKDNTRITGTSPAKGVKLNKRLNENDDSGLANFEKLMMHEEYESNSSGSKHSKGDLTSLQNVESRALSARAMHESNQAGKDADVIEGMKYTPSSCSETESTETKGRNACKEMDSSERESSSQKSSTDNPLNHSGSANLPLSKPMLYPRALSRATSGIPTVPANPVFLSSTQCPPAASGKNDGLHMWQSTSLACKPLDGSGNLVSNSSFAIKKCVGVFSEGKWKTPDEKPAFFPIRRTTSNIPQCSAEQRETHVSAAASQLKFARMGLDSTADASYKNTTDVSCENLSCASKLYLHSVAVKKEYDSNMEEEKPMVGLKGLVPTQGTQLDMMGSGMCRAKVKQEEDMTTFDGHILSKHQDPDTFNTHSGVINRQRSASFLDLPRVTTTGRGPNGKTINGVMYISSGRSVWLVCRCHGKHMSPAEFVEHSGSTDLSNPLRNIVVNPPLLFSQIATTPV